jgi:hypothetical protein
MKLYLKGRTIVFRRLLPVLVIFILCSTPVIIAAPPEIICVGFVSIEDPYTVIVVFDQHLEQTSAETVNYYRINSYPCVQAKLSSESANCVYLTLDPSQPMSPGSSNFVGFKRVANTSNEFSSLWKYSHSFEFHTIEIDAEEIMLRQFPNGSYNMTRPANGQYFATGETIWVNPYFDIYSALALILAHEINPDQRYLDSAMAYLQWHTTKFNPDGTINDWDGYYPNFHDTGDYDSSDSYAAMFILTSYLYYMETRDEAFLDWVWPHIITTAGAVDLTLQSDGLTWGKPDYLIKYTMDNSEVWQGYSAAARLAEFKGNTTRQYEWQTKADNVLSALETFYLSADTRYAIGKGANDVLITGWSLTYPDAMAQAIIIKDVLFDTNLSRAVAVWNSTVQKFVPNGVPYGDIEGWCVLAANCVNLNSVFTHICYANFQKLRQVGYGYDATYIIPRYMNIMIQHLQITHHRFLTANLNGDHYIDNNDLFSLTEKWLNTCSAANNYCEGADMDRNGTVDLGDFAFLANTWLAKRSWWD